MRRQNTKGKWLPFSLICIILGITSFSNHPNWGYALTLFGAATIILLTFRKVETKR